MSDTVISVENLGKRYILKHKVNGQRYTALRDVIARQAVAPFKAIGERLRRSGPNGSSPHGSNGSALKDSVEHFWALKDVSFEVRQGDVLGIIGSNGAGKSTLLKILSRITEPTKGRVRIKGRVASLLEVGTGFHQELTGRENIYLNGGILGMSRAGTRSKFDEIVAFAEVEKFLDTPVKRYSNGMYVRLAFAVAAHLEPEILIVDEVLAVGDAGFQKKCLGKMHDVATGGRTVLFVSHSSDSIIRLCSRALWLDAGSVRQMGRPAEIVQAYSQQRAGESNVVLLTDRQRPTWVRQKVTAQQIICLTEEEDIWRYAFGATLDFACEIAVTTRISALYFAYAIFTFSGFEVASARGQVRASCSRFEPGQYSIRVYVPGLRLAPGTYSLNLGLSSEYGYEDFVTEAAVFQIMNNETSAAEFADSIKATCIPESRFVLQTIKSNFIALVPPSDMAIGSFEASL
jgi:lipopolysaccharide transport system ATP-binding protein